MGKDGVSAVCADISLQKICVRRSDQDAERF